MHEFVGTDVLTHIHKFLAVGVWTSCETLGYSLSVSTHARSVEICGRSARFAHPLCCSHDNQTRVYSKK